MLLSPFYIGNSITLELKGPADIHKLQPQRRQSRICELYRLSMIVLCLYDYKSITISTAVT